MNKEELKKYKDVLNYIENVEEENKRLRETITLLNTLNENNYNNYCDELKINNEHRELNGELRETINKAIEEIDKIIELQELLDGEIRPTRYGKIKEILKGDSNE